MRHDCDVVLSQKVPGSTGCMRACVILLEQEVRMSPEEGHHMGLEDLGDVTLSCNTISSSLTQVLEDDGSDSLIQGDCPPNHDACASPRVPFDDVGIRVTRQVPAPHAYAPICWINAESAFVSEEDPSPLSVPPVHTSLCPLESVLVVLGGQDVPMAWSSAPQAGSM